DQVGDLPPCSRPPPGHWGVKRGLADPVSGDAVLIAFTLHGDRIEAVREVPEDRLLGGFVHGREYASWLSFCHGDARSTPASGRKIAVQGRPARHVSADASVAAHRRQGNPAKATEQDF